MYQFPEEFEWLAPWENIDKLYETCVSERVALPWSRIKGCETVSDALVRELRSQMPDAHILFGVGLKVIARNLVDFNEYLFTTDNPETPIVAVHLTWTKESNPSWPWTTVYRDIEEWKKVMLEEASDWEG